MVCLPKNLTIKKSCKYRIFLEMTLAFVIMMMTLVVMMMMVMTLVMMMTPVVKENGRY